MEEDVNIEFEEIKYFCNQIINAEDDNDDVKNTIKNLYDNISLYKDKEESSPVREKTIHIRVSEDEQYELKNKAIKNGFKGIGEFLRYVGLNAEVKIALELEMRGSEPYKFLVGIHDISKSDDSKTYFMRYNIQKNETSDEPMAMGLEFKTYDIKDEKKFETLHLAFEHCVDWILKNVQESTENSELSTSYVDILKASNSIAMSTRRSAGNVVVCSKQIAEKLFKNEKWKTINSFDYLEVGRFTVLAKPLPDNKIIVGYTGNREYDWGVSVAITNDGYIPCLNDEGSKGYYRILQYKE